MPSTELALPLTSTGRSLLPGAGRDSQLLAAIVHSTSDAIISETLDGTIASWNPGAERMLGWRSEEAIGLPICMTIPEDGRATLARILRTVRETGLPRQAEIVCLRKDQSRVRVSVAISPIREESGAVVGFSRIARNLTDRDEAQAALRASEERFRRFMDNCPAAAFIKDDEGRFVYVNRTWLNQFEGNVADWAGKTDFDFWPRETAVTFRASDQACLSRNAVLQFEETGYGSDGHERSWLVMKFPVTTDGKRQVGGMALEVTDRKRAEASLQLRDRAIRAASQGIVITDPCLSENPIIYASPGFERLTGYTEAEVLGRNCEFLQGPETDAAALARIREAVTAGEACTVDVVKYRKDGTPFWDELSISPVFTEGKLTHFVEVHSDATGRRTLEDQLRHAQKMEAVGQLAGGVAHDFNNLLTIIIAYGELLLDAPEIQGQARELIAEMKKAGERSAALTSQLLTFSRKQVVSVRPIGLNDVVRDTEKMLRRLISEDIRVATVLHPSLGNIWADKGQVEQILLNLAVNARDAMPGGGLLTVETSNVVIDEEAARTKPGMRPGKYVLLSVSDNGEGMTAEVKRRVFEPFFTTKSQGKGTGLGMAVVYGIVQQSEGYIELDTEPGKGTTFRIYFPRLQRSAEADDAASRDVHAPQGTETLLLVEDEAVVRQLASRILQQCGYTVLQAANGEEALAMEAQQARHIDLLVTDVVMPGMGGRTLAERLVARRPGIKVLYFSGYADDAVVRHGVSHEQINFLQKPFSPLALARKVRDVLA